MLSKRKDEIRFTIKTFKKLLLSKCKREKGKEEVKWAILQSKLNLNLNINFNLSKVVVRSSSNRFSFTT